MLSGPHASRAYKYDTGNSCLHVFNVKFGGLETSWAWKIYCWGLMPPGLIRYDAENSCLPGFVRNMGIHASRAYDISIMRVEQTPIVDTSDIVTPSKTYLVYFSRYIHVSPSNWNDRWHCTSLGHLALISQCIWSTHDPLYRRLI